MPSFPGSCSATRCSSVTSPPRRVVLARAVILVVSMRKGRGAMGATSSSATSACFYEGCAPVGTANAEGLGKFCEEFVSVQGEEAGAVMLANVFDDEVQGLPTTLAGILLR